MKPRMKPYFLLLILLLELASQAAAGTELVVIVPASSPIERLSLKQLARIYRRKVLLGPEATPWFPLNLPPSHPLRKAFSKKVLGQYPEEMETYWNVQYFNGILPPYVVTSEEAMRRYVLSTPGAIGYLPRCKVDAKVKIVASFPLPPGMVPGCR